jgi:hypothetical protein
MSSEASEGQTIRGGLPDGTSSSGSGQGRLSPGLLRVPFQDQCSRRRCELSALRSTLRLLPGRVGLWPRCVRGLQMRMLFGRHLLRCVQEPDACGEPCTASADCTYENCYCFLTPCGSCQDFLGNVPSGLRGPSTRPMTLGGRLRALIHNEHADFAKIHFVSQNEPRFARRAYRFALCPLVA